MQLAPNDARRIEIHVCAAVRVRRHELPPLQMGSLCISPDELLSEAGVLTEGDFEALCRMEITFKRKKGEYFACYDFGTGITPDSDQMVRIGTLAMIRLLLRCGSFRACYKKLDAERACGAARESCKPKRVCRAGD
jgi:hypothetical protein